MVSSDKGGLTLSIAVRVGPETGAIEILRNIC